ncbi:hypothetical protein IFM89_007234, partial [Coptis chinensis]
MEYDISQAWVKANKRYAGSSKWTVQAGSVDVLHCYYAHGEENGTFQRQAYWLLEEAYMHVVLVHYREVKGSKTSFNRLKDTEAVSNSEASSPLSSSVPTNSNHDEFRTFQADPRLSDSCVSVSFPTNDYDIYGNGNPSASTRLNNASLGQENRYRYSNDTAFGLNFDPSKQLDLASWEQVLERCNSGFRNSDSSTQYTSIRNLPDQENIIRGKLFTGELNFQQEVVGRTRKANEMAGLQEKHQLELENLTLTAAPFKMLKFFTLAVVQYLKRLITYLLTKGGQAFCFRNARYWLLESYLLLLMDPMK